MQQRFKRVGDGRQRAKLPDARRFPGPNGWEDSGSSQVLKEPRFGQRPKPSAAAEGGVFGDDLNPFEPGSSNPVQGGYGGSFAEMFLDDVGGYGNSGTDWRKDAHVKAYEAHKAEQVRKAAQRPKSEIGATDVKIAAIQQLDADMAYYPDNPPPPVGTVEYELFNRAYESGRWGAYRWLSDIANIMQEAGSWRGGGKGFHLPVFKAKLRDWGQFQSAKRLFQGHPMSSQRTMERFLEDAKARMHGHIDASSDERGGRAYALDVFGNRRPGAQSLARKYKWHGDPAPGQ